MLVKFIVSLFLFRSTINPYSRICKRCNSQHDMFQSNIEGNEDDMWWEVVRGDNEKCICKSYSTYRP